ncbi:unnamed protein product [Spirodela intermedia]|uniref:Uncharacterized protein n=1 Tax=Spirodela intermedia TaxID=51605 RepID=A0A7I8JPK1_SPIIN|nr:unnamed protein product [Spirodela intermedia]CAA6672094.1 unnamed protein product [Spirodela intermedia]
MKWVVELSPAAVTRRNGKTATLRPSGGCHLTERSWMEEVATRLPMDRPLPDDGLFVDQSEMIYSMDSRSFYRESFSNFKEALHLICYALKRWRLVSQQIILFSTTTCSLINQR